MPDGVRTAAQLKEVVEAYEAFDEFVFDVETTGSSPEEQLDPLRNQVFWISLAGPGRCDVIPCGHPLGEPVSYSEGETSFRISPTTRHYQERRVNPDSGREKWYDIPDQWTPAPSQLWTSEVAEGLRPLLFSERRKIGHNVKFDLRSMAKYYGEVPPPPYGDTEIAARLVNENYPAYKLGICVSRAFHFKYKKIGKNVATHPYSVAHTYSYLDSKYCWLLWQLYKAGLKREHMEKIFEFEMDLLSVVMDMENTGIKVDTAVLKAMGREFGMEMASLKVDIDNAAGFNINLNANEQVADLVYDKLGHPVKEYTPSGLRKTAKDVLEQYSSDPIVHKLLDYAALNKLQGTFVDGIQRWSTDNQVHPSFQQVGAVSGRMSCREPNIQQVPSRSPRAKKLRDVFVARPGKALIVADLSQIELRVLAHYTQDPRLLKAYKDGISLHKVLAQRVWGKDYTPAQYILAKNGNFSCLYGAAPKTLVKRYGFPNEGVARQVRDAFYDSYRRVNPWKNDVLAIARSTYSKSKTPYVETVLGRKRRLPGLMSGDKHLRWGAERQAISSIIQGSAADIFKIGMIDMAPQLKETVDGHILMVVHDEVVVEVPEELADIGLGIVKRCMEQIEDPWEPGKMLLSVPLIAEAHTVQRWSDAK